MTTAALRIPALQGAGRPARHPMAPVAPTVSGGRPVPPSAGGAASEREAPALRGALNAKELASIAHLFGPGFPGSERRVGDRARREKWPARPRRGRRGGGQEYPVAGLPAPVRAAIAGAIARRDPAVCALLGIDPAPATGPIASCNGPAPAAPAPSAPPDAPEPASLPDWQRRCRDARAAVLLEVDRLQAAGGFARPRPAIRAVVAAAAAGTLAPHVLSLVPQANARSGGGGGARTLSMETVYRWYGLRERGGIDALVPKPSKQKAPIPAWLPPLLTLYQRPQRPSLPACLEELPGRLPPGVAMPSPSAARRWLDRMAPAERNRGRLGPRALLALKAFVRRDTAALEPMDLVVMDGHTHRARCAHPVTGRPFQPEVMAVMDAATRYVFGWSAGLSESTHTVMDGLRHGVANLGLFAVLYTDNGSGFVNDVTSDELTGFYARLGCLHERATPGRAQARGLIERPNQSLWRREARRQTSYVGRDMDREAARAIDRLTMKDIREAGRSDLLPTWDRMLADLGAAVDAYNSRPHRALPRTRDRETGKLRHMSPAECLQSWRDRGWRPVMLDEREMDDLFRPQERRRTLRGEVELPWGRYFSHALVDHHGRQVLVGYDIHDGSRVWVRDQEGRLIAVAARDGNVRPYQPASKVEHGRDLRARGRARILRDRLELVEVERRAGGGFLDLSAGHPAAGAAPEPAALPAVSDTPPSEPEPAPDPGARPTFADDVAWAVWLAAHPDRATARDRAVLRDELKHPHWRALMEAMDVDLSALRAIAGTKEETHA